MLDKLSLDSEMSSTAASEVKADFMHLKCHPLVHVSPPQVFLLDQMQITESIPVSYASFSFVTKLITMIPSFCWKENNISRIFHSHS